jgi:hypothetical protein
VTPPDRARLLDAEMQLQRAWLEINLRAMSHAVRQSPWSRLNALKLGTVGVSIIKLWIAAVSLLINLYRRHAHKEKT